MRDLLAPKWLLLFLIVAVLSAVFISLGMWQLERWDESKVEAAQVAERLIAEPVSLAELSDEPTDADGVQALVYRVVEVEGTWALDGEILWRNRDNNGVPGFHVLTPLVLDEPMLGADVVLVDRGWVPTSLDEPPVAEAAPDAPRGAVRGHLLASIPQPGFGPTDPADGALRLLFNIDLPRLDAQIDGRLLPMFVMAHAATNDGPLPRPAPLPTIDTGQNISYAVQWFSFTAIAWVTTGIFVRRREHPPQLPPRPAT